MATLPAINSFEGGTTTTAISTANSGGVSGQAFNAITGAIAQFNNTTPMHGAMMMRLPFSTVSAAGSGNWTGLGSNTGHVYGRWYFRISGTATVTTRLCQWHDNAAALCCAMRLSVTNTLQPLNAAGTAIGSASAALTANTWYRIEYDILPSTTVGTFTFTVYAGDSPTAFSAPAGATGAVLGANIAEVRTGVPTAVTPTAAINLDFDDFDINTTALPGPAVRPNRATVVNQAIQRSYTW